MAAKLLLIICHKHNSIIFRRTIVKKKLFLESNGLIIGLPLVLAVCIFIGCASTGSTEGSAEPGTLTITGIPAEYEGKFVSFSPSMRIDASSTDLRGGAFGTPKEKKGALIKNGEAKLLLFADKPFVGKTSYTGSETIPVQLCVRDTDAYIYEDYDFVFESVVFENGMAEAKWDNVFKSGSITITGIPDDYKDREIDIFIGSPTFIAGERNIGGAGYTVKNPAITIKIPPKQNNKYESYTFTGTKDIMVALDNGKQKSSLVIGRDPSKDFFLFKAAQITDGKAVLDFRRGAKQ
jgi:hypothetical protein